MASMLCTGCQASALGQACTEVNRMVRVWVPQLMFALEYGRLESCAHVLDTANCMSLLPQLHAAVLETQPGASELTS